MSTIPFGHLIFAFISISFPSAIKISISSHLNIFRKGTRSGWVNDMVYLPTH